MKYGIYAIYDKRAGCYGPPMFHPTDVHAIRSFNGAINAKDPNSSIASTPQDFQVQKFGTLELYDGDTTDEILAYGRLTNLTNGETIADGANRPGPGGTSNG